LVALTTLKIVKETVIFANQVIVSVEIVFLMVLFLLVVVEIKDEILVYESAVTKCFGT
jgi:hypothetical protein